MSRPLLDTNVISELMRREPDGAVRRWAVSQDGFRISVVVLEELEFGLARKPLPLKSQWLEEFLALHCEFLPVTAAVARAAGALRGRFATLGETRHPSDMHIAATALLHRIPLATRNTADFAGCGISLINPFSPSP